MDLTAREGDDNLFPHFPMIMKDRHNEPVTKGYLAELQLATQSDLKELRQELHEELKDLRRENAVFHQELMEQLGVIDERLRHDVLGAGNDRIESLKNSREDHERRIRRLEKTAGLIAA